MLSLQSLEREAIVCHPDLQKPLDSGLQELPDEFFEVTVDDVRKRLAQLRSERSVAFSLVVVIREPLKALLM